MIQPSQMGKQPKCRHCRQPFVRFGMGQKYCRAEACAVAAVEAMQAKRQKAERKADKAKREKLKTRSDYMKEAQRAFNTYIRLRDRAAGHPCISSGRALGWAANEVDAGHYRSTGAAPHLRFDEDNCHAQTKQDNRFLAGNAIDYRVGLIARIGLERVEALESNNTPAKWTAEELKQIKATYTAKARELKKVV